MPISACVSIGALSSWILALRGGLTVLGLPIAEKRFRITPIKFCHHDAAVTRAYMGSVYVGVYSCVCTSRCVFL